MTMRKAFIAYARADKNMVGRLRKHLASLKREKILETWFDGEILAGEEWDKRIREKLETSDIVILCVSADFLDSDYVQTVEVPKALARHDADECIVIPVILTSCDWENQPFARLQVTPEGGKPVTDHANPDQAWTKVAKAIRKTIESMPHHTESSPSAKLRDAQPSRPQQAQIDRGADKSFEHAAVSVYSAGAGLAGVDILALFPNSTWLRETTNTEGLARLKLHSSHLPMTVFAAAPDYAACIGHGWVPAEQALALEMNPLRGGGSVIFPKGTGTLSGLEGQLQPIRDSIRDSHGRTHDRTYLYALTNAINDGQLQPVDFEFGEELHLADADGNERWVRIVYIAGRSALVEYRLRPSAAAEK